MTVLFRRQILLLLIVLLVEHSAAFGQRNLTDIPDPDPEIERKSFIVADGWEVNLYAADPQIAKPIQMNFDPQGRLWIASSEIYPHIKPGEKANDRILVVDCAEEVQLARLLARDNENEAQARRIIAAQTPREERLAIADDVIENDRDLDYTRQQVATLHQKYMELAAQD